MATNGNHLSHQIFHCEKCHYTTCKKTDFSKHLQTVKHSRHTLATEMSQNTKLHICQLCNKQYHDRTGLWKHKKTCDINNTNNTNLKELVLEVIHQNNEHHNDTNNNNDLIQYLINENKEFKNLILEISKKDTISNITNTINSNNKSFNINFFLNETCKDAMNMSDFINSLTLQLSDLENVGKLGFVDGISNIIIKNLEALEVEKRPVHCCDAKRETMYIKDHDKWEKEDNELKQMRELVRYVRDKNISMVNTWRDMYPECVKSDSKKTTQYNNIYMEAFGGETGGEKGTKLEKEEKIISRIAKSVIINKSE
jgi:ribosomal protein L37AE/L43A